MVGVRPVRVEAVSTVGEIRDEGTIEVLAKDGHVLVHAVTNMPVGQLAEADCHKANRRLTPTGWRWEDPHPEHLIRCADCLSIHPLSQAS
jgi:hypothetical protein